MWFLCKTFRKFPDDDEIENLDPMMRAWMFFNWLEDYQDEQKMLENQGYLVGSFINPELVKRLLGKDAKSFEVSDEEFDKGYDMIFGEKGNEQKPPATPQEARKRRRKKITNQQ